MRQTVGVPSAPSAVAFADATPAEVPAIVTLVESAYRGDSSRAGWTTEADLLDGSRTDADAVRSMISRPRSVIMLAYRAVPVAQSEHGGHVATDDAASDELLACCQLRDEGDGRSYFGMFAVQPDRQGSGIGRAVLNEAERRVAADWRCHVLRMTVIRQRTGLVAWYERRGFALTGKTIPFPYGNERLGLPKRPDLEFAELAKTLS
jgi:ribosomal protein S18 acetylase RimI-like enzyme